MIMDNKGEVHPKIILLSFTTMKINWLPKYSVYTIYVYIYIYIYTPIYHYSYLQNWLMGFLCWNIFHQYSDHVGNSSYSSRRRTQETPRNPRPKEHITVGAASDPDDLQRSNRKPMGRWENHRKTRRKMGKP